MPLQIDPSSLPQTSRVSRLLRTTSVESQGIKPGISQTIVDLGINVSCSMQIQFNHERSWLYIHDTLRNWQCFP